MSNDVKKRAKLMVEWKVMRKEQKSLDKKIWKLTKKMQEVESQIFQIDKKEREKQGE